MATAATGAVGHFSFLEGQPSMTEHATKTKWAGSIGPRMAKAFNTAWVAVPWEGKTRVEITGVVGQDESRHVLTEMCGEVRAEATAGLQDIGDRYEWTLTAENYKRVIAELDTLKRRLEESRPVVDLRRTPQAEAERISERKAADQDRAIEARAKHAEVDRITADLKARYPWAKQTGSDHARASANIKRELAEAFPGIKFSVRSDSFSGGDSVDIGWLDGPTSKEVEAITSKYRRGSFDGMTDCYDYDHSAYTAAVDQWLGSARYVHCQRGSSDEVTHATARLLCEAHRIPYVQPEHTWELRHVRNLYGSGDGEDLLTHVRRLVQFVSFPAVFEVIGLQRDEESGHHEPYTLALKVPDPPAQAAAAGLTCEVQQHHHTKRDCDFWLVVLTTRVDRDEFERLRDRCKEMHGWYSRQWGKTPGGFAFELQATANAFAKSLG